MIKGSFFSKCSRYIYVLATRSKYKTFLVKYSITPGANGSISTMPIQALDVHDQASIGMRMSKDGTYLSIQTCNGFIKVIDLEYS